MQKSFRVKVMSVNRQKKGVSINCDLLNLLTKFEDKIVNKSAKFDTRIAFKNSKIPYIARLNFKLILLIN